MGVIYKITNLINGKVYIGQTIRNPINRWRIHCRLSGNCRKLQNAIKKYGRENFEFKVLIELEDNLLGLYESLYIRDYDSIALGYNLREGGKHGSFIFTEEHKNKISKAKEGQFITEAEYIQNKVVRT